MPPPRRPGGAAPLHSSLLPFSPARHRLAILSVMHPPPLLLRAEKKRSAVHGVGEEEALGANQARTALLLDALLQGGKYGRSLAQTRMPRPSLSAAAPLVRTLPVTSSLFTLHSYFLLPRSVPRGAGSKAGAEAPGLGRFKGMRFLREGGNRNRVPQKRCFCGSPMIKNAPGEMNPPCAEIFAAQKCS